MGLPDALSPHPSLFPSPQRISPCTLFVQRNSISLAVNWITLQVAEKLHLIKASRVLLEQCVALVAAISIGHAGFSSVHTIPSSVLFS